AEKADSIGIETTEGPWPAEAIITGLVGRGASTEANSATSESGCQSAMPARQQSESGPTSPLFQWSLSRSTESGPTCFSSIATNQSLGSSLPFLPDSPRAPAPPASIASFFTVSESSTLVLIRSSPSSPRPTPLPLSG